MRKKGLQTISWKQLFALVSLLFYLLKISFALLKNDAIDGHIYELGFEFGPFVKSISTEFSFYRYVGEQIQYTSRMPMIPIFISLLGIISKKQLLVQLIKITLFSGFTWWSAAKFQKLGFQLSYPFFTMVYLIFCVSYPVIKHSSKILYEEAYLLELLVVWIFASLLVAKGIWQKDWDENLLFPIQLSFIIILLVTGSKSSMILLLLVNLMLLLRYGITHQKLSHLLYHLKTPLVLGTVFFSWWLWLHVAKMDQWSIGSSYDGENFYKGNGPHTLVMYPEFTLDRIMDSKEVTLASGKVYRIEFNPKMESFKSERDWHAYYLHKGLHWMKQNPEKALQLYFKKAYNLFISIEKSPRSIATYHDPSPTLAEKLDLWLTSLFLLIGRAFSLIFIYLGLRSIKKRDRELITLFIVSLLILGAYAIPYVMGYNFERHTSPLLVLMISATLFLGMMNKDTFLGKRLYS